MASSRVRVMETSLVSPAAGPDAVPARSVALTFFDVKWLHLPPVERVFLYRLSPDADVAAIVAGLKASLAQALRAFYPLAGRVCVARRSSSIRHELRYRPGDAVPFTTAEYECDMDKLLASDEPVRVAALAPLVPQLPKGRAVLAVQATTTICSSSSSRIISGLAVGVTVHHSACDGAGSTHFLHTWAAWACGAGGADHQKPPALDRAALIPDPRGLYDTYLRSLPPRIADDAAFEFVSKPPEAYQDKLLATFTLPKGLLEKIKAAVAAEAARRGIAPPPRCSTTLAAYALMWSCYCRCRRSTSNHTCYFLFSVDQRARLMNPPVPATYLGNCLCPAIATAPEDHLAAPGIIAGLFAASTAVAAALEEQVREGAQDTWDTCVDRVSQGVAHGMLSVAGSPRFRVYDLDFGFGRPAKVAMVSAAKGGAMPIAEARAGAGVEVAVSLPADGMERFQNTFADAIACLSSAA
ncbi:unnamed protein product [Urochloa decumbens]|uniref:Uncharacterized protein n=1 Tax=Urochloa decumbens TaxID=240449 RepID=A0ABC9GSK5_9POAL